MAAPPQVPSNIHGQESSEPVALRNLMVNYIPTTIDEMQLRQLFEMYGPIESIKIVCDKDTRQSRGYGFVKYRYAFSAVHATQYLNGYPLMNKRLKVAYANAAEAQKAAAQVGPGESPYNGQAPQGEPPRGGAPQGGNSNGNNAPNANGAQQGGGSGQNGEQNPGMVNAYMQQMATLNLMQQYQQQMLMAQQQQQQQLNRGGGGSGGNQQGGPNQQGR